ncbi:hypothetical protein SERLADRAFT_404750 [Serpula lacrymans var. lacrymans S7.9]|nr:uncharacterized protein SERLADRAFT_404750 [Serpula lacrymans var. lacrymans S7.9]EGO30687.1 hypothetical protein SERLADRAFT_404750 [Serpula lacrymans var. lacrymans S7.9]
MDFWEDVVGRDPDKLAMLFEQWACSRNQTVCKQEDLADCRQLCTRFCRSGLRSILKRKTKMPFHQDMPFVNPSVIGTVLKICKLREARKTGSCHWVKLTQAQLQEHKAQLNEHGQAGEVLKKKRKKKSDAGVVRKRRQITQNSKNERELSGVKGGEKAWGGGSIHGFCDISRGKGQLEGKEWFTVDGDGDGNTGEEIVMTHYSDVVLLHQHHMPRLPL